MWFLSVLWFLLDLCIFIVLVSFAYCWVTGVGRFQSDDPPSQVVGFEETEQEVLNFTFDPNYFPVLKRAHPSDAGLDLGVAQTTTLNPENITTVDTGVRIAIPKGYVGFLFLRSSFAFNHPTLRLLNNVGVIDSGYTGNIKAVFENTGEANVTLHRGERFAQLVVVPCLLDMPQFVRKLQDSERGEGGFGSTGK